MISPKDKPTRGRSRSDHPASVLQESASASPSSAQGGSLAHLSGLQQKHHVTTKTNEWYADLFESAPVGYLALDSKGTISEINLTGARLLGGERHHIAHRLFSEFVMPEDIELWRRCFTHVKRLGEQQSCELFLRRIDGIAFHARLDSRHAEVGGTSTVCVVLADISGQKRREKETMEWRSEMAELRKMQIASQTAAAIVHELNQPLLAISTYSEAALKLLKAENPVLGKIVKAVTGCERQAQRAGKSIHELLDFLSLKEIEVEAFDLNQVIGDVVNAARLEHEMQFESILLLEGGLPPVFANRTHVEKVFFNLLRNGIEAMHEAGVPLPSITVTVRTQCDTNAAQVTVQDNGPGIKEEYLQQLFKPFFTTKPKGIGMGLAVSRSLIEANGGQLWVDPQEGPGAIFHLTLPLHHE